MSERLKDAITWAAQDVWGEKAVVSAHVDKGYVILTLGNVEQANLLRRLLREEPCPDYFAAGVEINYHDARIPEHAVVFPDTDCTDLTQKDITAYCRHHLLAARAQKLAVWQEAKSDFMEPETLPEVKWGFQFSDREHALLVAKALRKMLNAEDMPKETSVCLMLEYPNGEVVAAPNTGAEVMCDAVGLNIAAERALLRLSPEQFSSRFAIAMQQVQQSVQADERNR